MPNHAEQNFEFIMLSRQIIRFKTSNYSQKFALYNIDFPLLTSVRKQCNFNEQMVSLTMKRADKLSALNGDGKVKGRAAAADDDDGGDGDGGGGDDDDDDGDGGSGGVYDDSDDDDDGGGGDNVDDDNDY
ncbi:hypothetical protein PoB_006376700 [Plakobranchus ocellatus]|uniref:Uncharacterized protein n=1 Tax=Plakobranchus ocellatus TaxID=259542 RepID=A0AAV4CZB2_9GAST|nr:hypothetical protein PoB_006376700 [Plakobranchus ocellatus]